MPRRPNPAVRQQLIAAGRDIIFRRGFNGCGVQDITAAAGVPKGSFYNYFKTKDAFVVEVIEDYWLWIHETFEPILRNARIRPLNRVAKYFCAMSDEKGEWHFALGCLIGNLSLELGGNSEDARAKLSIIFKRWQAPIAECLREAQRRTELSAERDVEELAASMLEAWEGAVMRSKVERRREAYGRFETLILPCLLR
jgi:TetR/AcrR family transcriptional repressor of nem operon